MLIERSNNSKNMRLFNELLMLIYICTCCCHKFHAMPSMEYNFYIFWLTYHKKNIKNYVYMQTIACASSFLFFCLFLNIVCFIDLYMHIIKFFLLFYYSDILHSQKNKQQQQQTAKKGRQHIFINCLHKFTVNIHKFPQIYRML